MNQKLVSNINLIKKQISDINNNTNKSQFIIIQL